MSNLPGDIIFFVIMAVILLVQFKSILNKDEHANDDNKENVKTFTKEQIKNMVNVAKDVNFLEVKKDLFDNAINNLNKNIQVNIEEIKEQDPNFDLVVFLKGAITAFGMIVIAYAKGEIPLLKKMLDEDLFKVFKDEIGKRNKKENIDTKIDKLHELDVIEAKLQGSMVYITVKFVSEQTTAIRDENGQVLKGDPEQPNEITDVWTFSRDVRSDNPNWLLVDSE